MARYNDNSSLGWKILSLFLTLILIAGVITGVVFWQKGNIQFIPVGQEQTEEQPNEDSGKPATGENGEELPADQTIPMPMAMAFRSAKALDGENARYDSVTVNATVKPADVDLKSFVFTVEWVNPASDWATGKTITDYFTVTPSGTNSKTATLQCLQPFGEQIKVVGTATSLDNKTASAECTVDFVKRVIGWEGMFFDGPPVTIDETTESISFNTVSVRDGFALNTLEAEYSAYTIDDDIALTAHLGVYGDVVANAEASVGIALFNREAPLSSSSVPFLSVVANEAMTALNESSMKQYVNPFVGWLYETRDTAVFYIRISGQSEYQTIDKKIPVKFSASGLVISVESVEFDSSTVII